MNKILQFELWEECNNCCSFCYLGAYEKETDNIKLSSLDFTINKISNLDLYTKEGYDIISYIGGEFFQGQMNDIVYNKFLELIYKTIWLYDNKHIRSIWLMLTMTNKMNYQLKEVLDLLKGRCVWIATSYDTKGRFHKDGESNWNSSMKYIRSQYPEFNINITTILTKDLISKYLNNEFSFKYYLDNYNCEFFLKQCGVPGIYNDKLECNKYLPWFFPTRSEFLHFLTKFKLEESELMWDKLFNIEYRADTLYRYELNGSIADERDKRRDRISSINCQENYKIAACGHLKSYQAYSDCDGCVLCDKYSVD